MNKQDLLKLQTCVLRVNIDCDGCKQKVKKLLQKIEGVYSTKIDAETGKVTVTGNFDPTKLVRKLVKSGKHAEIWSFQKGSSNFQGNLNNQFKNTVRIENSKVGQNNSKAQNNGTKEFDGSDGEFDDDDGDQHEFHHGNHHGPNKMMAIPMMGKNHGAHGPNGVINGHAINDNKKGGIVPNKKGGVMDVQIKGKNGKSETKKGNNGNYKGCDGEKSSGKGVKNVKNKDCEHMRGSKGKKPGKSGGGLLGFGKKSGGLFGFGKRSCKGGDINNCKKIKVKGTNNGSVGGGGGKSQSGPKKGGEANGPRQFNPLESGFREVEASRTMKGGKGGGRKIGPIRQMGQANGQSNQFGPMGHFSGLPNQMGQMGNINGQMGNYPMGNIPAVQGPPAQAMINGGYYPGVGPANPYNQQYMAMMMNQQRANGNDMYHPMMFARPFPPVNYSVVLPISPATATATATDNYTHFFNDENANSCSIM